MQADVFDPMSLYDFGAENLDPNVTYGIEAQEIFEIGTHKGIPYDGNDNKTIVENFRRFYFAKPQPLLMPPAVIGHEEDQAVLKRSDLPAAGWVTACFILSGTKLAVNISEIPALVMYWIKTGKIRTVSAEIYVDSGEAGLPPGYGPTLRRIAFLGGDIPQVKTLARLKVPVPEQTVSTFSESSVRVYTMSVSPNVRYFAEGAKPMAATVETNNKTDGNREDFDRTKDNLPKTNSEGKPMKNPKLFDELKQFGEDVASQVGDMDKDKLQQFSACLKRYADVSAPPTDPSQSGAGAPFDRTAAIELIASKNGIDRAMLQSKTDDELKALLGPSQMSDSAEDPTKLKVPDSQAANARVEDTTTGGSGGAQPNAIKQAPSGGQSNDNATVNKNSERYTAKFSEGAQALLSDVENRLARAKARLEEQERREKLAGLKKRQAKVNKFCEDAIAEGKVTPAELAAGLKDTLLQLDDETVKKFSDGSSNTALDGMIASIKARPKLSIFSEKMPVSRDALAAEQAEADRLLAKTEAGRKVLARRQQAAASGKV